MTNAKKSHRPQSTHLEVRRLLGDLEDAKIIAILALNPSVEAVEEAAAWIQGESDVMGNHRKPLDGIAAEIFDILSADLPLEEDR